MFKHLVSELREALVCLRAGQVTLGYPFQPHPPDANFRGKVVVDTAQCIGCGACAMACPAGLITLRDDDRYRVVDLQLRRCTYCAQCRDVCPQKAITLSSQFETATATIDDMSITLLLKLARCRHCGAPIGTQRALNKIGDELTALGLPRERIDWLDVCLACKRQQAAMTLEVSSERAFGLVFQEIDLGLSR